MKGPHIGNLHLKYYWYYGTYKEFAEGEIVFKPEYVLKDQLVGNEAYVPVEEFTGDEKDKELDENLPGYGTYYNADMTSELFIYTDGYARYCPSIDSVVNFYGKYIVKDNMLVIQETDSKYIGMDGFYKECVMVVSTVKFEIVEDKIILKEYIDSQGKIHTYDEAKYTFTYNTEKIIESLRPGKYYNGDDKYVSIDGKGKISLFLNLDKEADLEKEYFYDYMMGTYEVEGDTIYVTGEDGNSAELIFDAGKLTVTKYKFYEATEADDNGELTFFYNYDDLLEIQMN